MQSCLRIMALAALLVALNAFVGTADGAQKDIMACIDAGFEETVANKSREFSSPQYRVLCDTGQVIKDPPGCQRDDKDQTFTFDAPDGFQIEIATFKVVDKKARTAARDLIVEGRRASIALQCRGGCEDKGHSWIAGNIVGRLVYQTSNEDAKNIVRNCLQ